MGLAQAQPKAVRYRRHDPSARVRPIVRLLAEILVAQWQAEVEDAEAKHRMQSATCPGQAGTGTTGE